MELTSKHVSSYLALLCCTDFPVPNKSTLDHLIVMHQRIIPFSSLDIYHAQSPPDLTLYAVYEKVVERRRGGYCFELNLLFKELLVALGYQARPVIGRAILGREHEIPLNHCGILVSFDEDDYYVDVGFGGPIACGALALEDGRDQRIRGEVFRLTKRCEATWTVARVTLNPQQEKKGSLETLRTEVEFYTIPVLDTDFNALNVDRSSPGSPFYESRILNIRTLDGYCKLSDNVLTIAKGQTTKEYLLNDEEAIKRAEEHYFGFI